MKTNFMHALSRADAHKEVPFPKEEFSARLARMREVMAARGLDLCFVMAPESIYYLSGFQGEWYQAQSGAGFPPTSGIAVHAAHDRYIHFETPSEAMLTAIGTVSEDVRIFPLDARRDGLPFILGELGAEGWLKGRVGLELSNYRPNPAVAHRYVRGFEERGLAVEDATDVIRKLRHLKSPAEMEALDEAARIADIGMSAARDAIEPGVTELAVFGEMIAAMTKAGGEFSGILPPVMSGFRSNCLHPLASRKKLQEGERVNVDLCGVFKRYHCNLCRSYWIGEPPDEIAEFHARTVGVYALIEDMLKPGLRVRELLEAMEAYYREQGIWDDAYWSGGYELGIAFPPDWVGDFIYDLSLTGGAETFEPNTVVNHECNFFAPRASGISATIDTFFFHETSARIASSHSRELQALCT